MSNKQKPDNLPNTQKNQQELVDLPEQVPQTPWKQFLLTPKFLLLLGVSIFFIGRNIYLEMNKVDIPSVQTKKKPVQKEQMAPEMYDRFFWYIVLTIVFFAFYIFLKRKNDDAEEEKIRQEVRKQEDQALKKKKIQQKANRILTSMDQFGNVIDQSAFKKKQQPKQQSQQSKKNQ